MKNTFLFPLARPLIEYPQITIDDPLERFPELESAWGTEDKEREMARKHIEVRAFLVIDALAMAQA